jgi:hypothetical protein
LEQKISTEITQTKQKLLENFDAEVHEKLKINLEESREYLSRYEKWLWNLTKYYLRNDAQFSDSYPAFTLTRNPFEGETIHPGPYRIGKGIDDSNVYRIGHRLAELIIEKVKGFQLEVKTLSFDLTKYGKKISALNDLQQKSGWIAMRLLAIDSFEGEDHVILLGITDEGTFLDDAQCRWLFELPAEETEVLADGGNVTMHDLLNKRYAERKGRIIEDISTRNSKYFENELEKLDYWGEDKRSSLKIAMKELDDEIKRLRKEIRLAPNLPEKINLEKQKRKLEADRNDAWKRYDEAAKAIETQKDKLIDDIEKKLQQQITEDELFLIRWQLR